jgi:ankyrin repeat protein
MMAKIQLFIKSTKMNNFLQLLIAKNDIDSIKDYVGKDIWLKINNFEYLTILMYAMKYSHLTDYYLLIKLIIENTSRINMQDNQGNTALMYAIKNIKIGNTYDVISLLLEHGADPNIKNNIQLNSLMLISKFTSIENIDKVCELLLHHDVCVDVPYIEKNGKQIFAVDMMASGYTSATDSEKQMKIKLIKLIFKNASPFHIMINNEHNIVERISHEMAIEKIKYNCEQKLKEQKKIFEEKLTSLGKRKYSEILDTDTDTDDSTDLPELNIKKAKNIDNFNE